MSCLINFYGIDPGSVNMGISIIQVNPESLEIVKIISTNLKPKKIDDNLIKSLIKIKSILYEMFQLYPPYKIIIEEPFMGRFIQSYKVLTTITTALELIILETNYSLELERIPVLVIKSKLQIKDIRDKDSTTQKMLSIEPYADYIKKNKFNITQDQIDSLSICHYGYLSYIEHLKKR